MSTTYGRHLRALMPPGRILPVGDGSVFQRLLDGLGLELGRLEVRGRSYLAEVDPRETIELLPEWERMLGLPDGCAPAPETIEGRRAAVVARLQELGGQSRAFFVALASTLGYQVEIEEHGPFQVGLSRVGDPLASEDWRFVWTVHAPEESVQVFRVGSSAVGEPLASWGNEVLECAIGRTKPAHTLVRFAYDLELDAAVPELWVRLLTAQGQEVLVGLDEEGRLLLENALGAGVPLEVEDGELVVGTGAGDVSVDLTEES